MPRVPITPEQREQIRKRIRDAASRLTSQRGLEDVSARAIASEAGVSVGTIYSYYENLSELAQSLWQEPVDELKQQIAADVKKIKDPVKRIRVLLEHYARFASERQSVFKGAFLFVRPESMTKPEKTGLEDEIFFCYLRDAIIDGQNNGKIRKDNPTALAQTLWAGIHGALALPTTLDRLDFDSPQKMAKHMISSLLTMIKTDG